MKFKKNIVLIIALFITKLIFSEDFETNLFETYEKSVVYIAQAFYLDEKKTSCPEIYKRIESHYKMELLNKYLPVASGTGFFLSGNGYIITNHHVIEKEDEKNAKNYIIREMIDQLLSKMPISEMNNDDYKKVREDIKNVINSSNLVYCVKVNNKDDYLAQLIISDKDKDLALLKIEAINMVAAPLGNSTQLKVGNQVVAIGYPIQFYFSATSKTFKSTLTQGTISALRNDDLLSLQHTASINPGNSGGPLFNKNGDIVGINTAQITNTNNIYFSIPVNTLTAWLSAVNQNVVISLNYIDAVRLNGGLSEYGQSISIDAGKGYNVYVNNELKGQTPIILQNLKPGDTVIKIESDEGVFQQKIVINSNVKDVKKIIPYFKKYTQKVSINSNVKEANIFIDNISIGSENQINTEIEVGKHIVKVSAKGYFTYEKEMIVTKKNSISINVTLEKGYGVTFNEKIPENTEIVMENGIDKQTYKSGEDILLKNGKWKMTIKSPVISDIVADFEIINKDIKLDIKIEKKNAFFTFINLKKNSIVYIDGKNITKAITDNKIELDVGKHEFKISTSKFETISFNKFIEYDKDNNYTIIYVADDNYTMSFRNGGYALIAFGAITSIGFIMFPVGLYVNSYYDNMNFYSVVNNSGNLSEGFTKYSSPYAKYKAYKEATQAVFIAGLTLSIISFSCFTGSIPLLVYHRKLLKGDVNTSFFINAGDSIETGICLNF